jgi:hypothetical protein
MIESRPAETRLVWGVVVLFAVCSAMAAIRSHGFLEADGATHYIIARHAFEHPAFFTDVWGRPLCTTLLALGARAGGLVGARMVSLIVAIGCGLVAGAIARGQGYRRPELALLFTLGQPLLFFHSFSELTELPFALVTGGALLAYQRRNWGAMALLAAIAPLGRPEGFVFLPIAAIALAAHRQWKWITLLPVGLAIWSAIGKLLTGPVSQPWWKWLIAHWPYEAGSLYQPGSPLKFVMRLPMIVGPILLPAMWIGMGLGLRAWRKFFSGDQTDRVEFLISAGPLAVLVGHSLLYWRGMFSSNGELRYLLVAAPMWGLLSARGWEWIFDRLNWRRPVAWGVLAAAAPALVGIFCPFLPADAFPDARQFASWYRTTPLRQSYPRIMTNDPGIYYYLDISPANLARVEIWSKEDADHPEPGLLMFWDPIYAVYNADPQRVVSLAEVRAARWIELQSGENGAGDDPPKVKDWHIFKSPLSAER